MTNINEIKEELQVLCNQYAVLGYPFYVDAIEYQRAQLAQLVGEDAANEALKECKRIAQWAVADVYCTLGIPECATGSCEVK